MAEQLNDDVGIGQAIQRRRVERGLSQEDVAALLNSEGIEISQVTLSKLEAGTRPVRLTEAGVIARVLGSDVSDFLHPGDAIASATRRLTAELAQAEQAAKAAAEQKPVLKFLVEALTALAAVSKGAHARVSVSSEEFAEKVFGRLPLHEVDGVLTQLLGAGEEVSKLMPRGYSNNPTVRSSPPPPGLAGGLGLVLDAVSSIDFLTETTDGRLIQIVASVDASGRPRKLAARKRS